MVTLMSQHVQKATVRQAQTVGEKINTCKKKCIYQTIYKKKCFLRKNAKPVLLTLRHNYECQASLLGSELLDFLLNIRVSYTYGYGNKSTCE